MPKKEGDRANFCYGMIGTNNTGKSSKMVQIALTWKKANPGGLVVSFDPQDNFGDITDFFIDPEDDKWPLKCSKFKNTLFLLDDIRLIHEQDKSMKGMRNFLFYRTKRNIDIIHACHAPSDLLNILARYTTHYFIFFTNSQDGEFQRKIPNYSLCKAASLKINKYVSLYGRGEYPIFPYMYIDCEKQTLTGINMNNKVSDIRLDNRMESKLKNPKQNRKFYNLIKPKYK